jgi:serine protease Do
VKLSNQICLITCPALGLAAGLIPCLLASGADLTAVPDSSELDVRRDTTVLAVEQVMPTVVNIATETIVQVRDPFSDLFRQFWDPYHRRQPPNSQYSLGSGVVIDEAGYVLTNDHVVRRADKIAVKFSSGTNIYEATLVANDPKSDIALLKLNGHPGEKFRAIKFAREDDLLLGETVLALGNPFGLGGSVTRGILSSKSRMAPKEGAPLDIPNWLQTDAPINLGNSGGPLVNLRGELIGINVAVLSEAQGIGFAIPIKRVMAALSEIFPTESVKAFWFGARVKVGTTPLVISSVQPKSPAGKAGLKPGDAILEVNGRTPKSFIDFTDLLTGTDRSDVALKVRRGAETKAISVRLVPEHSVFNAGLIRERLGLVLEPLSAASAARYGLAPSDAFVIAGIEEEGPAASAGLQRGMLVTSVDGQVPADIVSAAKLIYAKKKDEVVHLEIVFQQRVGGFNVLRPGAVDVPAR